MEKYSRIELMCRPDVTSPDAKFVRLWDEYESGAVKKWLDLEYEKSMFIEVAVDSEEYELIHKTSCSISINESRDTCKICSVYAYTNDDKNTCKVYNVNTIATTPVFQDVNIIWMYITVE